ncbi:hypothetical protein SERLA73DRAFT_70551 [Serpula lacrymans var. lacrymans S7.3]|uniref:CCHC-type domain-containing protein n=2 Tax=Serpula lacrymans var. lacrymans TaxID=341189 RepID=F8PNA8_SERL3|nr:uncharacterized protein SERLADRAFT_434742 [Serpula lacrymans var. lacrymans S7.9]EGO03090.1 hypothetical protein SERLA73DRAFT_70551 [Serpula lacrymans var. lacrymans S7.3]EGO28853.1 hypothetical protein SERLADRAFT_434742 [Serpula lacrymans var. lacrymans S7.9]
MSSQPQDVNALLHNMRQQILALTTQLADLQANLPAANPSVEKKFNKKVKVVADPGAFEGDRAMQECYTAGVWPTWDNLKIEIKKYFKPQAERDWARQQIRSFQQGNIELLERNVNPRIAEQIYLQDTRNKNLALAAEEVRRVGRAMELYAMHQGGGSTTKNNQSQRRPGSSNHHNHSHGFKPFGLQPRQGAPMDIGAVQGGQMCRFKGNCYNCDQEGHMSRDCRKGAQAAQQKNNQGRQARQLESEKPDDRLQTLAGLSYDEIRAFFYDQQAAEMKAQGKESGA